MKQLTKILKQAEQRGWYLARESRHYIYKHKKGGCVTVSKTPSEVGALKDIEHDFIRVERINAH